MAAMAKHASATGSGNITPAPYPPANIAISNEAIAQKRLFSMPEHYILRYA